MEHSNSLREHSHGIFTEGPPLETEFSNLNGQFDVTRNIHLPKDVWKACTQISIRNRSHGFTLFFLLSS